MLCVLHKLAVFDEVQCHRQTKLLNLFHGFIVCFGQKAVQASEHRTLRHVLEYTARLHVQRKQTINLLGKQ